MQIDDMHIKRCYTLLANSEIQVKTTMRYDFHSEEWLNVGKDVEQIQLSYIAKNGTMFNYFGKGQFSYKAKCTSTQIQLFHS